MSTNFAERMKTATPSFIRESLKLSMDSSIISFAGGNPDSSFFPIEQVETECRSILKYNGQDVLQYSVTEGYTGLRAAIMERMKRIGIEGTIESVAITSGSQQGLDLSGKLFLDKGDEVIVESPSYMGAINAFKYYEPKFVEVEMDDDGMRMDLLEEKLCKCQHVKMIYTIPDFQNPTGRTMSLERRKKIVELAERFNVMIIEDSPYYDLRFEGEPLPPIKKFDQNGRVVYLGSMSKILCPALRVGWIVASPEILRGYVLLKQAADLHSNELAQEVISGYMAKDSLDFHIERMNVSYRGKRDLMLDLIENCFPPEVKFTRPKGGLFLWLTLPEYCDAQELFRLALKTERICFVPGDTFYPYGGHANTIRLSYATVSGERICEGMERLTRILNAAVGQKN